MISYFSLLYLFVISASHWRSRVEYPPRVWDGWSWSYLRTLGLLMLLTQVHIVFKIVTIFVIGISLISYLTSWLKSRFIGVGVFIYITHIVVIYVTLVFFARVAGSQRPSGLERCIAFITILVGGVLFYWRCLLHLFHWLCIGTFRVLHWVLWYHRFYLFDVVFIEMAQTAVVEELHLGSFEFLSSFLTCSAEARLIDIIDTRLPSGGMIDIIDGYVSTLGLNISPIVKRLVFSLLSWDATRPLRWYLHWTRLIEECLRVLLLSRLRVDDSVRWAIVLNTWNLWVYIDFLSYHSIIIASS